MMELRIERGKAIAATKRLRQAADGTWVVLSQTRPNVRYRVNLDSQSCTCPDYETWELPCKHQFAVKFFLANDHEGSPVSKPSYHQDWPAYNAAQIHEKEHFEVLLKSLCGSVQEPPQTRGRPRLPLAERIYACTTKVYTTMSGRRASTDVRSCRDRGHLSKAPHHSSISNYLNCRKLTPVLTSLIEQSAVPLKALERQFAVDATGFGTSVYDHWLQHKHGAPRYGEGKKKRWLKAHAAVGTNTNVVTAVRITKGNVADVTQLSGLVLTTANNFDVAEVSADKAYLSHLNQLAIEAAGATPFIPFKSNSKGGGPDATEVWKKLWHMFWFKRDEWLASYHRRSNVESTFSMIKRKFGGSVRSKKFDAQVNEVLCKILAHNIVVVIHESYEMGVAPTSWANSTTCPGTAPSPN